MRRFVESVQNNKNKAQTLLMWISRFHPLAGSKERNVKQLEAAFMRLPYEGCVSPGFWVCQLAHEFFFPRKQSGRDKTAESIQYQWIKRLLNRTTFHQLPTLIKTREYVFTVHIIVSLTFSHCCLSIQNHSKLLNIRKSFRHSLRKIKQSLCFYRQPKNLPRCNGLCFAVWVLKPYCLESDSPRSEMF